MITLFVRGQIPFLHVPVIYKATCQPETQRRFSRTTRAHASIPGIIGDEAGATTSKINGTSWPVLYVFIV